MSIDKLISVLEILKAEHGPGCKVRTFEVSIYANELTQSIRYNHVDYVNVRLDPLSVLGAQG